jgi:hypothetical protein
MTLHRAAAAILLAVWWVAQPLVEWEFYTTELHRGAYPVHADSIIIPIARFTIAWMLITPVVAWFLWQVFRRAPKWVSWTAFDRSRPVWSAIWTLLLAAFGISELEFAYRSTLRGHLEDVASGILAFVVAFSTRALICAAPLDRVGPST